MSRDEVQRTYWQKSLNKYDAKHTLKIYLGWKPIFPATTRCRGIWPQCLRGNYKSSQIEKNLGYENGKIY